MYMNGTHQDTHQDTLKYIEIQYDTYPIGNVPKKDRKSTVTPGGCARFRAGFGRSGGPGVRAQWPSGAGRRRTGSAAFSAGFWGCHKELANRVFRFRETLFSAKIAKCYEGRYHKPYSSMEWLFWARK